MIINIDIKNIILSYAFLETNCIYCNKKGQSINKLLWINKNWFCIKCLTYININKTRNICRPRSTRTDRP